MLYLKLSDIITFMQLPLAGSGYNIQNGIVGNASSSVKENSTVLGMSRVLFSILNHLHQDVCSFRCIIG